MEVTLKTKELFFILVVFQGIKHQSVEKSKEENFVAFANHLNTRIKFVINRKAKLKLLMMPNIVMCLRLRKKDFYLPRDERF